LFRIKICGITNIADAVQAIEAGADALGVNFYPKSPRCVNVDTAWAISRAVRQLGASPPAVIGVFVNFAEKQLRSAIDSACLDAWQLHGDETPELVAEMSWPRNMAIDEGLVHTGWSAWSSEMVIQHAPACIRAFRCRAADLADVANFLQQCRNANGLPQAVLLDAYAPDAFGGTGKEVDWNAVREQRDQLHGLPVILAGGLTPDNVAQAIRTARPDAVDVASGVESSPGKKDPAKVREFVAAATAAFAEIASEES
jgi:phosphoribosylanthranilate isomerase